MKHVLTTAILSLLSFSIFSANPPVKKNTTNRGQLSVQFSGAINLLYSDIDLYVNEKKIGTFSFNDGFSKNFYITKEVNTAKAIVKVMGTVEIVSKCKFIVNTSKNYTLMLQYNHILGNFNFKLVDQSTGEIIEL